MFEKLTEQEERGQVGIGTLIVFIAMVLVAAIAAGVLISTAGELQAQGEATGEDSQSQVSDTVNVVHAVGEIDSNQNVSLLNLTVMKSPGAETIQLEETTIHFTSSDVSQTLTYNDTLNSGNFNVSRSVLSESGQESVITIDLSSTNFASSAKLEEGQDAVLNIIDQSGATTVFVAQPPEGITSSDSYVAV
ncbi:archaellin/type IV pilin N-terminal domain-containing protein [Halovivax limisalsi]|uniref:archaellin/type IV pilin N-terminal domain-containing protein n=1 Tax=Halovivax limisalsi TaxID=1453760 RepID=UPI001FFD5476|nr:archaellin/type IV pilin N-terminal domain-containing protein [Halovivax limisalsi]